MKVSARSTLTQMRRARNLVCSTEEGNQSAHGMLVPRRETPLTHTASSRLARRRSHNQGSTRRVLLTIVVSLMTLRARATVLQTGNGPEVVPKPVPGHKIDMMPMAEQADGTITVRTKHDIARSEIVEKLKSSKVTNSSSKKDIQKLLCELLVIGNKYELFDREMVEKYANTWSYGDIAKASEAFLDHATENLKELGENLQRLLLNELRYIAKMKQCPTVTELEAQRTRIKRRGIVKMLNRFKANADKLRGRPLKLTRLLKTLIDDLQKAGAKYLPEDFTYSSVKRRRFGIATDGDVVHAIKEFIEKSKSIKANAKLGGIFLDLFYGLIRKYHARLLKKCVVKQAAEKARNNREALSEIRAKLTTFQNASKKTSIALTKALKTLVKDLLRVGTKRFNLRKPSMVSRFKNGAWRFLSNLNSEERLRKAKEAIRAFQTSRKGLERRLRTLLKVLRGLS